jgi:putative ABC transport system permease protein
MSTLSGESHTFTNVTYNAWSHQPRTIDGVAGWDNTEVFLGGDSGVERIPSANVTPTLFPLLGESPLFGANFTEDDARSNNTVILSYGFWQERFGGARDVLGKQITLSGRTRTIIAVMPRGFEFPTHQARLWTPFHMQLAYRPGNDARHVSIFNGLARLKPGVTPEQAASEGSARLNAIPLPDLKWMLESFAGGFGAYQMTAVPMRDWVVKDVKPALWILLAAGGLLLAAAVGTVVNLQLAQATARRREVAIRSAIGAGAGRLARQLFVETTTIAAIGGALGLALTLSLLRVLPALLPADFPRAHHIGVDARVFAVAAFLTMAVSLGIGLLPARMARRVTLTRALSEDGSAPIGQSLRSPVARSRSFIITAQVAIAAVLLVGGALLSKSFTRLLAAERGYTPGNLLTARVGILGRRSTCRHASRVLPRGSRTGSGNPRRRACRPHQCAASSYSKLAHPSPSEVPSLKVEGWGGGCRLPHRYPRLFRVDGHPPGERPRFHPPGHLYVRARSHREPDLRTAISFARSGGDNRSVDRSGTIPAEQFQLAHCRRSCRRAA